MRKDNRAQRAKRKEEAAKRTAWNTYSIHDRKEVARRISIQHDAKKKAAFKSGLPVPTDSDMQLAIQQNEKRYAKFRGDQSKYTPHQGNYECMRRAIK